MTRQQDSEAFDFDGPATYEIVVQGTVGENWHGRLGGMAVETSSPETGVPQTHLRGWISDQAALHGVLETLYALHLPILEVRHVPSATDDGVAGT